MSESSFHPRFALSRSVRSVLRDIDRDAALVAGALLHPRHEAWFRREVTSERAVSTTRIEGIGEREAVGTAERREVAEANENAVRAYELVDYLSDLREQPIDELVIRQINREFLRGASPALTPGVYRKGQNLVGNYTPPDQGDVPALMREFVAWLQREDGHAVARAAISHLHLVALHPFWDGNGRTARCLETLMLQRSDLHCRRLLSFERRLLASRPQYFAAIERTLGARFGDYDATPWLEFYAPALAEEIAALGQSLADWHRRAEELRSRASKAGLLPRMAEALLFVSKAGRIARSHYIEIMGVSPMTASRDLKVLVESGFLSSAGRTATTTYQIAPDVLDRATS